MRVVTETHHPLHASVVIPDAVEHHDSVSGPKVSNIALEIPLRTLPVIEGRQGCDTAAARFEALRIALDDATFSRRIPDFEHDDPSMASNEAPFLKLDQVGLQAKQPKAYARHSVVEWDRSIFSAKSLLTKQVVLLFGPIHYYYGDPVVDMTVNRSPSRRLSP